MITKSRIIGACLLGLGVGGLGFAWTQREEDKPVAPVTPPRAVAPAPKATPRPAPPAPVPVAAFRPFKCVNRQTNQVQVDIPKARVQFLRTTGQRSYWRAVTPTRTIEFDINPANVVCSYAG